jgi:sugar lactone lactonase YvrE
MCVHGVGLSNGLDWSPDGRAMYFIDSRNRQVDVFDFDAPSGDIENRRVLVDLEGMGIPDGMTVDARGGLWVAFFGEAVVRRFLPDGSLERSISFPVPYTTSCAFGGPDLGSLYVTTSSKTYGRGPDTPLPDAGALFVLRPGVSGTAPVPFDG